MTVTICQPRKKELYAAIANKVAQGINFDAIGGEDWMNRKKNVTKRYYAFESHQQFYDHMMSQPEAKRNMYEIVAGDKASFFYLDIDHYDKCGLDLIDVVVKAMEGFLKTLKLDVDNMKVLVLQSPSTTKESYHMMWRGKWVLDTNMTRRHMFDLFVQYLETTKSPLLKCGNATEDGKKKEMLDRSVYSVFQNFRMVNCSKFGEQRPLVPIAHYCSSNPLDYFISYMGEEKQVITLTDLPTLKGALKERPRKSQKSATEQPKDQIKTSIGDDLLRDYNLELPNAHDEDIQTTMNDGSIDFLLKCIPNGGDGQNWNVWVGIGMAVHRASREAKKEEIGKILYENWSKQSSKYDSDQTNIQWQSFSDNYREEGYNRNTLIRLARMKYPGLFTANLQDFDDMTKYNSFIVHYNEQYVRPYDSDTSTYLESSYMGSGKTYQIAQYIRTHNPTRVLCLSPKQSFALNFAANLNEELKYDGDSDKRFVSYLELMRNKHMDQWHQVDRIVIQMESLFKIANEDFVPYDLLIVDECESNLKCFNSATMLTPIGGRKTLSRLNLNLEIFEQAVKTSKVCIFADAFLTNRTLDIVDAIRPMNINKTCIRINDYLPPDRRAIKYKSYAVFEERMISDLRQNKRIVVFWGSKRRGKEFEAMIRAEFPAKKVKFYHADADDALDKDLEAVNLHWSADVDVLMYSAKITVGVSFTIASYFDNMYLYGYAGGACPRDVAQSILRVRMTKSNTLHYFADGRAYKPDGLPTNYGVLQTLTDWKCSHLNDVTDTLEQKFCTNIDGMKTTSLWNEEIPWMRHLYILNRLEDGISITYYHIMLDKYVQRCGYDVEKNLEWENPGDRITVKLQSFKDLAEMPDEQIGNLKRRIECRQASMEDKLLYRKHQFKRLLKTEILSEGTLQKLWQDPNGLSRIQMASHHKHRTFMDEAARTGQVVFMSSNVLKIEVMYKLATILKVQDLMKCSDITPNDHSAALKYVKEHQDHIFKVFEWSRIGLDHQAKNFHSKLLQRICKETCEATIKKVDKFVKKDKRSKRETIKFVWSSLLDAAYDCQIDSVLK